MAAGSIIFNTAPDDKQILSDFQIKKKIVCLS